MPGLFENTVSAIAYDIARAQNAPGDAGKAPYNDVGHFVLESWRGMPRFLAWPLRLATMAFSFESLLLHGALYHRMPAARRAAHLATWRHSAIGPCRDLARFYDSLALLAFYSRSSELAPSATDLSQLAGAIQNSEVIS